MHPAQTQINLYISPGWSEFSFFGWRNHWHLIPKLVQSEISDLNGLMSRQVWDFSGPTVNCTSTRDFGTHMRKKTLINTYASEFSKAWACAFIYINTLCLLAAKARAGLRICICADMPEPLLHTNSISTRVPKYSALAHLVLYRTGSLC